VPFPSSDLAQFAVPDLLKLYAEVVEQLRLRGVTRTSNNPAADYAEYLCENGLSFARADNSTKGFDAIDGANKRYQIKARRLTKHNGSRQLGAMRGLDAKPFDYLAAVLFDGSFRVLRACQLPIAQVRSEATFVAHTNSWKFMLADSAWSLPGAVDITQNLVAEERKLVGKS